MSLVSTFAQKLFLPCFLGLLSLSVASVAEVSAEVRPSGAALLSYAEFRGLANDLAPKVNLFVEVWQRDPKAEFYGGTTRDFLYWIKGKLADAKDRNEALRIAGELRKKSVIDVRDFIIGDSDVDLVAQSPVEIDIARYGVRRIDSHGSEIFDPKHPLGASEIDQGYIPAEKIRLGKNGLFSGGNFGDGVQEIFSGKLTAHFSDPKKFAQTLYAQQQINHPILLALRFLRLQAMNYYAAHGRGYPDLKKLLDIDPRTVQAIREVVQKTQNGKELTPYLKQVQFAKWINAAFKKSFRSYTNPTATMELMKAFGADQLPKIYAGIDPLNQYLFAKHRDPKTIDATLAKYKVDVAKFYQPVASHFPNGKLYHGTAKDPIFRAVLLQGILASEEGSAGEGLYGVALENRSFAETWKGGTQDHVVQFDVDPSAKLVNITQGEGKRIFDAYMRAHEGVPSGVLYERFADEFGVDIMEYPYRPRAYVVKNSAVLGNPEGTFRGVLTISKALEKAARIKNLDELGALKRDVGLQNFNTAEAMLILDELESGGLLKFAKDPSKRFNEIAASGVLDGNDSLSNAIRKRYMPDLITRRIGGATNTDQLLEGLAEVLKSIRQHVADPEVPLSSWIEPEALRKTVERLRKKLPAYPDSKREVSRAEIFKKARQLGQIKGYFPKEEKLFEVLWPDEMSAEDARAKSLEFFRSKWREKPVDETLGEMLRLTLYGKKELYVDSDLEYLRTFAGVELRPGGIEDMAVRWTETYQIAVKHPEIFGEIARNQGEVLPADTGELGKSRSKPLPDRLAYGATSTFLGMNFFSASGGKYESDVWKLILGEQWPSLTETFTMGYPLNETATGVLSTRLSVPKKVLNQILARPLSDWTERSPDPQRAYMFLFKTLSESDEFYRHPKAGQWIQDFAREYANPGSLEGGSKDYAFGYVERFHKPNIEGMLVKGVVHHPVETSQAVETLLLGDHALIRDTTFPIIQNLMTPTTDTVWRHHPLAGLWRRMAEKHKSKSGADTLKKNYQKWLSEEEELESRFQSWVKDYTEGKGPRSASCVAQELMRGLKRR